MAYAPFSGGQRICFGKTFAEIVNRMLVLTIFHNFNLEFVDPKFKTENRYYGLTSAFCDPTYVRVTLK